MEKFGKRGGPILYSPGGSTCGHRRQRWETMHIAAGPHGVARYNSRGIFHSVYDAFPPYLQPEVSFIEGNGPDMSQATRYSATVTSALDSPMGS